MLECGSAESDIARAKGQPYKPKRRHNSAITGYSLSPLDRFDTCTLPHRHRTTTYHAGPRHTSFTTSLARFLRYGNVDITFHHVPQATMQRSSCSPKPGTVPVTPRLIRSVFSRWCMGLQCRHASFRNRYVAGDLKQAQITRERNYGMGFSQLRPCK